MPCASYVGPQEKQSRFVVRSGLGGLDEKFVLSGSEECKVREGGLLSLCSAVVPFAPWLLCLRGEETALPSPAGETFAFVAFWLPLDWLTPCSWAQQTCSVFFLCAPVVGRHMPGNATLANGMPDEDLLNRAQGAILHTQRSAFVTKLPPPPGCSPCPRCMSTTGRRGSCWPRLKGTAAP